MTTKSQKTIEKLQKKAEDLGKMPSIKAVHEMLTELNVSHTFHSTTNVVEYRSKGCRYVNSRHDGKDGFELEISISDEEHKDVGTYNISMDTSDSYYSWNSWQYARQIIKLLKVRNLI